jgi:hypothetical protein
MMSFTPSRNSFTWKISTSRKITFWCSRGAFTRSFDLDMRYGNAVLKKKHATPGGVTWNATPQEWRA